MCISRHFSAPLASTMRRRTELLPMSMAATELMRPGLGWRTQLVKGRGDAGAWACCGRAAAPRSQGLGEPDAGLVTRGHVIQDARAGERNLARLRNSIVQHEVPARAQQPHLQRVGACLRVP